MKLIKKEFYNQFRDEVLDYVIEKLDIKLFPKQNTILRASAPVKIVRAARRTSKSFSAALDVFTGLVFGGLFDYPMHYLFAGPRSEDSRHMWLYFWDFWNKFPLDQFDCYKNYKTNHKSPSTHKKYLIFENGTFIKTASLDDVDMEDVRGSWFDGIKCDEFGLVTYKDLFLDAALYSLKDEGPLNTLWIFGTSEIKVDLGGTFSRLFDAGQNKDQNKIKSYHFSSSDIPAYLQDKEAADVAKTLTTKEGYLREGEGLNVPRTGVMFKEFDHINCIKPLTFNNDCAYFIGVDFGFRKPVVIFSQYINRQVLILEEINLHDVLVDQLINEIKLVIENKFQNIQPVVIGADKAGTQKSDKVSYTTLEKFEKIFPQTLACYSKELISKQNQVNMLQNLVKENNLIVNTSCKNFLSSLVNATYDVNVNTGGVNSFGWKKIGLVDDPLDALCYGLINYGSTSELIVPDDKNRETVMSNRAQQRFYNQLIEI